MVKVIDKSLEEIASEERIQKLMQICRETLPNGHIANTSISFNTSYQYGSDRIDISIFPYKNQINATS